MAICVVTLEEVQHIDGDHEITLCGLEVPMGLTYTREPDKNQAQCPECFPDSKKGKKAK